MDLLGDLKTSRLNFIFVMIYIYIIHIIMVVLKNHLNYLKDNIFECFLKEFNRILLFYFFNICFYNI